MTAAPSRFRQRPLRRAVFAVVTVALSMALMAGAILGLDLYLHRRFDRVAGLNIHGYGGPLVKPKAPGEVRLVMLGGSTALGYGVPPEQSIPAHLERILTQRRRQQGQGPVSVVNIAANGEGVYAFKYNLRYFERLGYDGAVFYVGYNDLGDRRNTWVVRQQSPIFRLTGYLPITPLIFQEKAMAIRHNGDLEGAYRNRKTVFRPNIAGAATAEALEAGVRISRSLERQLDAASPEAPDAVNEEAPSEETSEWCGRGREWGFYCEHLAYSADYLLDRGRVVMVVNPPFISKSQKRQYRASRDMLRKRFPKQPRLSLVNLGDALNLKDPSTAYDGMHLTGPGNERIAQALAEPVLTMLERMGP
jgi:lysophospholipase L1-like esterase